MSAQHRAGRQSEQPHGGAVMIDTERLFDSLNRAREFTVTEDHLKLLRHLCDGGLYWDPGEGYGAPFLNPKQPYGNSDVPTDVAQIVKAPDSDLPQWDDDSAPPAQAPHLHPLRLAHPGIPFK